MITPLIYIHIHIQLGIHLRICSILVCMFHIYSSFYHHRLSKGVVEVSVCIYMTIVLVFCIVSYMV